MSKRDAAPTHGWVIGSQVNKFIVRLFWIILIVVALAVGTVWAKLEDNCMNTYEWSGQVFGYVLEFKASNDPVECR